MAKGLKYKYSFKSFSGDNCEVQFYFEGWTGSVSILNGGSKPFVLKEYNSDNDFFKPIRPFQAEMEILSDMVTTEDFLADSDDAIEVQFLFNGDIFWRGWLIQDDFQENWIDTNHYITLRATDALGQIDSENLPNMVGQYPMLDYLSYCLENTTLGTGFANRQVVNNLFYEGMQDRDDGNFSPLTQVTTDAKTFEGDNKLGVLEKINRAWSMTLYQWRNRWFFARLEEWLTNKPLKGLNLGLLSNTPFTKTYEVLVGVAQSIKPIMPEMLKSIRRAFKNTKIKYFYEFPIEIVCNQNFLSGEFIIPSINHYTIDCWSLYKTSLNRTIAGTAQWYRVSETDPITGEENDTYLEIQPSANLHYVSSTPISLNYNDVIAVEFDVKYKNPTGSGTFNIGYIVLEGINGKKYTLDDDGTWWDTLNYTVNQKALQLYFSGTGGDLPNSWKTYSVRSSPAPSKGNVYIYLSNTVGNLNFSSNHKNLTIVITENSRVKLTIGDYDQYTLPQNITQNYEEQTYLDDANNNLHKGALFFNNNLTGDRWYRMDYSSERLTFKREKAIAHMTLNRRLRRYLQVNMLGNVWIDESVRRPIWLQNKFIFTEDAPTKKWMIVNLSEMDFSTTEWKAQLVEVWDDEIDSNDPNEYPPHSYDFLFE